MCEASEPDWPIDIPLPGEVVSLTPDQPAALFERTYDDIETQLGMHRFAWLDVPADTIDPAWSQVLWKLWVAKFGHEPTGWAWHPYTAAERAINIINFATHHGWPGDADTTQAMLASHAPVIASQLEYYGEHDTSNHLANNGRGLFILGVKLGLPHAREVGLKILIHEAERIFLPSGMLREGSSHYHALYARRYTECAELGMAHGIEGADKLANIATRAMGCLASLKLPGRFPLIGDISPDIAPQTLLASLDFAHNQTPINEDGWLRVDHENWHGLWHASRDGWSQMPGHGHQDVGSFELHWHDEPLFVDAGRGAYGESGDAALYRSAAVHNCLTIDDQDPYPPNKPYYSSAFRNDIGGSPPTLSPTPDGVSLSFNGYKRLRGVGTVERRWQFTDRIMTLTDKVAGSGRHVVRRNFVTPLSVQITGKGITLRGKKHIYRFRPATKPIIKPITIWQAYGQGESGFMISFEEAATLPWQGKTVVEVL